MLVLFSLILYGLTVGAPSIIGASAALVATCALAAAIFLGRHGPENIFSASRLGERRLLLAVLLFGAAGAVGWAPSVIGPTSLPLERFPGVVYAILAVWLFIALRSGYRPLVPTAVCVVALVTTLGVGLWHLQAVEGIELDVNILHAEAALAIADGVNPYTDAVVAPDGSPRADPGDTIVGYPYPPIAAVAYAIGEWTFSDPRYTSLASWLVVLGLLSITALRRRNPPTLYLFLLLASLPGWPLVLRAAWTEPFSLALLTAAFLSWPRSTRSGVALGLGLASKQYFLVAAPLVLLHRDPGWRRRLVAALVVMVVTVGSVALLDFGAFWMAAVEFHATTPPRPDSSNLVGLLAALGVGWSPPAGLSVGVGVLVGFLVGRLSRTAPFFALATGLTLAASFLVSSQAFSNYWFLVAGLCAVALATGTDKRSGDLGSTSGRVGSGSLPEPSD